MITVESHDRYSVIRLDRPDKANALDAEHCQALGAAVAEAHVGGDRAVVVTGSGSVFSAGADFSGVGEAGFGEALYGMLHTLTSVPIPVVGAVNGHAIGAGMQVALACDLRVVADEATFSIPTARLGLAVDPWTIDRLVAAVGAGSARRILMTCDRFGSDDPSVAGLVDRRGDLADAFDLVAELASMAPLTLGYVKAAVNAGGSGESDPSVQEAYRLAWNSSDGREGLRARREGRPPEFRGE